MLCNREHGGAEIEQPQPAANPPTAALSTRGSSNSNQHSSKRNKSRRLNSIAYLLHCVILILCQLVHWHGCETCVNKLHSQRLLYNGAPRPAALRRTLCFGTKHIYFQKECPTPTPLKAFAFAKAGRGRGSGRTHTRKNARTKEIGVARQRWEREGRRQTGKPVLIVISP